MSSNTQALSSTNNLAQERLKTPFSLTNDRITRQTARVFFKNKNWYYISNTYQASHHNLYALLMSAKNRGE